MVRPGEGWSGTARLRAIVSTTGLLLAVLGVRAAEAERPVFGVHDIELAEGVAPAAFEKFVREEFSAAWKQPRDGMMLIIAKGDRGDRKGKYQLVFLFDSAEARDMHFPSADEGGRRPT